MQYSIDELEGNITKLKKELELIKDKQNICLCEINQLKDIWSGEDEALYRDLLFSYYSDNEYLKQYCEYIKNCIKRYENLISLLKDTALTISDGVKFLTYYM